jgi:hypothetical protein
MPATKSTKIVRKSTTKTAPTAQGIALTFEYEKSTKNCLRFQEVTDAGQDRPIVGTLYVLTAVANAAGISEGDTITVTISK